MQNRHDSDECACSVWLSQAPNSRGFMAKLRDFGLQPELHTNMLPLTAVTHAAPELVSQVNSPFLASSSAQPGI